MRGKSRRSSVCASITAIAAGRLHGHNETVGRAVAVTRRDRIVKVMRIPLRRTRVLLAVLLALLAGHRVLGQDHSQPPDNSAPTSPVAPTDDPAHLCAAARTALAAGQLDEAESLLRAALSRYPDHAELHLTWIDAALARGQYAAASSRFQALRPTLSRRPEFCYRAAQAYYRSGMLLGKTELCTVPGGQPGQFVGQRLLLERRAAPDVFLCCPPQSALYQLRQALDGGLDEPAAHVLHARIWQKLGQPRVGLALLRGRLGCAPAETDDATLEALADLALDADALPEYLRYTWLLAERHPEHRHNILPEACLNAAERYARRGDERLYVEWLRRAARWRPSDPDLLLRLADGEWDLADYEAARASYTRLLQLAPAHPQRGRILNRLTEVDQLHLEP